MEEKEKKIDETWKETVKEEKKTSKTNKENEIPTPDFKFFLSSLGLQAMIALGELENPLTRNKEDNLPQAKYLIDILGVIKEKTKNNLDKEEAELLDNLLYQLRTIYISKANKATT